MDPRDGRFQRWILESFKGTIGTVEIGSSYQVSIMLSAFVMLALPLVYVSLLLLVCYVVARYTFSLLGPNGDVGLGALVPAAVGIVSIVFLVKPFFARHRDPTRTRSLTREGEPLLFALVDRICDHVNAPRPKRIDVDHSVNAAASFRRGILSMFGDDLVLTIGMPFVAGLTMQQFAGVIAHEFGHFTQGAGMRLRYLVLHVSHWFHRVVYERDAWDYWLERASYALGFRLGFILWIARFLIWVTRKILWVLMMLGHAVAGYTSRQMEYDADRYEARMVGSREFEMTCWRLQVMMLAHQGAVADSRTFYRDGKLADNLPELIMSNVSQVPKKWLNKVAEYINESRTGIWDSHPCDRDRILSARAERAPGIFHLKYPARHLFFHYERLCKNVTWDLYSDIFGAKFKQSDMHPLQDLLVQQSQEQGDTDSLMRFCQGVFSALRPLRLPEWHLTPASHASATAATLAQMREQVTQHCFHMREVLKNYRHEDGKFVEALQAVALYEAGFKVSKKDFEISVGSKSAARQAQREAGESVQRLGAELEVFEQAVGNRLWAALRLLHTADVAARIPGAAALQAECLQILPPLQALSQNISALLHVRNGSARLGVLCGQLEGNGDNQRLIDAIRTAMQDTYQHLVRLGEVFHNIQHPLDHAHGQLTVQQYLLPVIPLADDLGGIYEASDELIDKFASMYVRLAARLGAMAEAVEASYGLAQLPEIPNEEDD